MKKSGLADSPFFSPPEVPSEKETISLIKTPASKRRKDKVKKPKIMVARHQDTTIPDGNRDKTANQQTNKSSRKTEKKVVNKPSSLPNEAAVSLQPDIPKHFPSLVTPFLEGKNDTPFSHHIPEELKKKFGKLPHYLEDELGYKPTIAQILIIALAYTFWDYEKKKSKSIIFEVLKTLKK